MAKEGWFFCNRCRARARGFRLTDLDLEGITAKVKPNGHSVVLSGGRLKGSGLLPYGVRLRRAGVKSATVKLIGAKESLEATLEFAGIDLSNLTAAVSGSCVFTAEQ